MTKRWIRRTALLMASIAAYGLIHLYLVINVFFQPERLVRKFEKRLNCRASIGAVDLSLFSRPSRLVIHDLQLAERDDAARNRTPLAERKPVTKPLITAKKLSLAVSFPYLLIGMVRAREMFGSDIQATSVKPENGDHSLKRLFARPDGKAKARQEDRGGDEKQEEDYTVDRLKVPISLRSGRLENLTFVMELEERKTRITWHDLNIDLTEVELSRSNLQKKNHAQIAFEARVDWHHLENNTHYGRIALQGTGTVKPVDVETRKFEPEAQFQITALPNSYLETEHLIEALSGRLGALSKFAVKLDEIELSGDLVKEARLQGNYKDRRFTLTDDTTVEFEDFLIRLERGSWYEREGRDHHFHSRLTLGPAMTQDILKSLGFLPPDILRRLMPNNFVEDDKLTLKLATTGDIGSPRVDLSEHLPEIDVDTVKDSAKDLLDGLKSIFK